MLDFKMNQAEHSAIVMFTPATPLQFSGAGFQAPQTAWSNFSARIYLQVYYQDGIQR
jgi:hypothetical protein